MKKIFLPILLLLSVVASAQNDFKLSEQWFSRLNTNPAATGNTQDINIFYMNRQQWVGFDDSPKANLLNAHTSFDKINSGFGVSFAFNRPGGASDGRQINAKLAYSYQVNLRNNMLLAFGVSAGVFNSSFDFDKLRYSVDDYRNENLKDDASTKFDLDLGAEFSMKYLLVGLSCTHLPAKKHDDLETQNDMTRQVYTYVRGNIPVADFDIAPTFIYSNSKYMNIYELNATAFYKKLYWLGVGYRFNANTFNAMIGAQWRFLRVGYSYDMSCGRLADLKRSTHEFMVSLKLNKWKSKSSEKTRYIQFM